MPEPATTEFWKTIKPIAEVFKPDALPEAYVGNAPTTDERYYVPFTDTVSSRPLWISPQQNQSMVPLFRAGSVAHAAYAARQALGPAGIFRCARSAQGATRRDGAFGARAASDGSTVAPLRSSPPSWPARKMPPSEPVPNRGTML